MDMSKPGTQAYYDSMAGLYVAWGVDFAKADDRARPYVQRSPEAHALRAALDKTGRTIILSLSPGPAPLEQAADLRKTAEMWRISDDFWNDWKLLKKQFDYARDWAPYLGLDGTWPDPDMLPLGTLRLADRDESSRKCRLNPAEHKTVMTLWAIFRSPLIFGGDRVLLDPSTESLLTNPEVLAVNQASRENHQSLDQAVVRAWIASVPGSRDKYVAVFNLRDATQRVTLTSREVGIEFNNPEVRDLWQRKDLGRQNRLEVSLPAHASLLYRLGL